MVDTDIYDSHFLIKLYRKMLFFRRFEERVQVAYTKKQFSGFCHLHIGQEGVATGVQEALEETDYVISSYRSHTQAIAKGVEPKVIFSELLGKKTGCCQGKGGSMHIMSKKHRFLGGFAIVGGQAPLATGVAFAIQHWKKNEIIVCYLGDGALQQGQVMESFNLAAIWNLPVLFIIENNQYGMGTHVQRVTTLERLSDRALGFNMQHSHIDGMDVLNVYRETKKIVLQMRKDKKPYLLEINTYRYRGHSVSDPATYRTKEEVEGYKKLDPIVQLKTLLLKEQVISEEDLKKMDKKIQLEVRSAQAYANDALEPPISDAWKDVFVEDEVINS